jgi:hypothetical protein
VFTRREGEHRATIALYVDDALLAASSTDYRAKVIQDIRSL